MERTKSIKKNTDDSTIQNLSSQLLNRALFASTLGRQYGGDRDIYKALGYPAQDEILFADYFSRYCRQDMAKAVIDRPVKACWQGSLEMIESTEKTDTAFELEWRALDQKFGLKTKLSRVDRLTGIGRYGVLLLGLDDVKKPDDFKLPVNTSSKRKLLYVKPFGEESAKVDTFVSKTSDPRYGLPLIYNIQIVDLASNMSTTVLVHHSRVIHITDDPLESEVYGIPRLEAVYNRLMDLDKVVGGDGEMFWRGARPGYSGKVDPDFQMTEATKTDLKDQISEYENNLRRILVNEGVDLTSLEQQIADPEGHVNVIIQMISAATGIPKRILTGSERGELASSQDSSEWKEYVQARRDDHLEPNIVRPFIDKLIAYKIISAPKDVYTIKWADLYSQSEKAKVEIGKGRANALREYTYSPMSQLIVPPDAFMEFFLGFTTEQITLVHEMRGADITEEELNAAILEKALEEGKEEPVVETIIEETNNE